MKENRQKISIQESKQLLLEMMVSIDQCCRDNNIEYSLSYGTLLGAVRHQGFIPWDDDIDLMMTRDNFERFKHLYYSDRYEMLTERDKDWGWHFVRICDTRTKLIFDNLYERIRNHGLWIAIFPVDNVPDKDDEWQRMVHRINFYEGLRRIKHCKWAPSSGFVKNVFKVISRWIIYPIPHDFITNRIKKSLTLYNERLTQKVFERGVEYHVYPSIWFNKYVDLPFEGHSFRAISSNKEYLTLEYGDYMTPPPASERVPKHGFTAYWKK